MSENALRDEWLRRLRSGEDEQTTGVLTTTLENGKAGYCCIGVAADILAETEENCHWDEYYTLEVEYPPYAEGFSSRFEEYDTELPSDLLGKFDVSYQTQTTLIRLNDGDMYYEANDNGKPARRFFLKGLSFAQIAEAIEDPYLPVWDEDSSTTGKFYQYLLRKNWVVVDEKAVV